jgi:hypothetical protein
VVSGLLDVISVARSGEPAIVVSASDSGQVAAVRVGNAGAHPSRE